MTPKPERLSDAVTLYEGDCLDVLPTLTGIDAVVTDPPYGQQAHAGARSNQSRKNCPDFGTGISPINFKEFTEPMFVDVCRKLVEVSNRWVISFCEWQFAHALKENGLPLVRLGVWAKLNPMPQMTGDRPGQGWEAVAILHSKKTKKRWNGGGSSAVWNTGTTRYGYFGPSNHPTEKPLSLMTDIVSKFTDFGETILDPFAGSGTTGVAAVLEGRKCILIEKDPKYCDIIRRRIADAEATGPQSLFRNVRRPQLFDGVEAEQCVA